MTSLSLDNLQITTLYDKTLALYIHWPFCVSKCPYCDFNSHVRDSINIDHFDNAYQAEIEHFASITPPNTHISSIYFGGGTPSTMSPKIAERIIDSIHKKFKIDRQIEITLEANPGSTDMSVMQGMKQAGINRVVYRSTKL